MIILQGLTEVISVTVVDWLLEEKGWRFVEKEGEKEGCSPDPICGKRYLREIYQMNEPDYCGVCTVPVLFDKQTLRIVNNESSEIIRMLNNEFNDFCENDEQRKVGIPFFSFLFPDLSQSYSIQRLTHSFSYLISSTFTQRNFGQKLTKSTNGSTQTSTTESIDADLPNLKKHTTRLSVASLSI